MIAKVARARLLHHFENPLDLDGQGVPILPDPEFAKISHAENVIPLWLIGEPFLTMSNYFASVPALRAAVPALRE